MLQDQVSNVFKGVIASVTGFGFFCRCDELFIDGLVRFLWITGTAPFSIRLERNA